MASYKYAMIIQSTPFINIHQSTLYSISANPLNKNCLFSLVETIKHATYQRSYMS